MKILYTKKQAEIADQLVGVMDSKFFKSISEPVRIQIIKYLLLHGRTDIGTIAQDLPQDRSVISRHLNLMQEVGILRCEKESRHMFYSIDATEFLNRFTTITDLVKECIEECGPLCCK
jgi:DNA-binding transcriptional ArsR family regulator